jgi:ketosteroid isomerase-like protein
MSRENVELARWAFTSGPARFFSLLDEDVELDARRHAELPGAALAGRGRDVLERYCREFWGTWSEYLAEPQEFIEVGDHVVVEVHERGKGKGSGVPFERTHFQVWTLRDGRLVRWMLFADKAEALEAAGRRE